MFARFTCQVVSVEETGDWAGEYTKPPQFEYPCRAPLDYLEFLITHADDCELIAHENLEIKPYGPDTLHHRKLLFEGDPDVRAEALRRLLQPNGTRPGRGQWHVLEGVTQVDCALFSEQLILFVEGKRTEPRLTDKTDWYRFRRPRVQRGRVCSRVQQQRSLVDRRRPPCARLSRHRPNGRSLDGQRRDV